MHAIATSLIITGHLGQPCECVTQIEPLACARPPIAGDKRRVSTSSAAALFKCGGAASCAGFVLVFTLTAANASKPSLERRRGESR